MYIASVRMLGSLMFLLVHLEMVLEKDLGEGLQWIVRYLSGNSEV